MNPSPDRLKAETDALLESVKEELANGVTDYIGFFQEVYRIAKTFSDTAKNEAYEEVAKVAASLESWTSWCCPDCGEGESRIMSTVHKEIATAIRNLIRV